MSAQRFRKKPVVIEAIRYDGRNATEIMVWAGDAQIAERYIGGLSIWTLEGTMEADVGDWIIRGVKGEFYPCKPDVFEATYEAAGPDAQETR
jgi:hypothetical protein